VGLKKKRETEVKTKQNAACTTNGDREAYFPRKKPQPKHWGKGGGGGVRTGEFPRKETEVGRKAVGRADIKKLNKGSVSG